MKSGSCRSPLYLPASPLVVQQCVLEPPMGLNVAISCGLALVCRAAPVVRQRAQDRHFGPRPVVARRQRQLVRRVRGVAAAMAQSVVHHELQPGGKSTLRCGTGTNATREHLPWIAEKTRSPKLERKNAR